MNRDSDACYLCMIAKEGDAILNTRNDLIFDGCWDEAQRVKHCNFDRHDRSSDERLISTLRAEFKSCITFAASDAGLAALRMRRATGSPSSEK
jgi:hypothetical protein